MASNVYNNFLRLGISAELKTCFYEEKNRFVDIKSNQQLLRVDQKIHHNTQKFDVNCVDYNSYSAVVISDYNKGFLDYSDIEQIQKLCSVPVFIDTKKTELDRFAGCILKINDYEWSQRRSNHPNAVITCGSNGVRYKQQHFPTPQIEVYDVCGAGDTFLAAMVFDYLNNKDMISAILFAQKAASITVRHSGVYAPTLKEIENEK